MDSIPQKQCTRCKQKFPQTTEYFKPDKRRKDGLFCYCRKCVNEYKKAKYHEKPRPPRAPRVIKDEEYYRIKREKNAARCKKRYQDNHEESLADSREYRKNNPEKTKSAAKRYREEHLEEQHEYLRNYRKDNPEKVKAGNRKWYAENIEIARMSSRVRSSRRRARKKASEGNHTIDDIQMLLRTQPNCWWCGKPLNGDIEVDHRIALGRGGSNKINNLVLSHRSCNRKKHDKFPWEFNGRLL